MLFAIALWMTHGAYAQLNDRFYGSGYPPFAQNAGAYASNIHVAWRQVQKFPSSSYNWNSVDSLIQTNQSAGLRTMITLRCTHPITVEDSTPGTCAYIFDHGTTDNNSSWAPQGADTTRWENFISALVERYDGDGINDMPGLIYPVRQWHIGQEWQRIWCSSYPDTSLSIAQEFVRYVNMTYDAIKNQQSNSEVSFAGIDTRHQSEAFYDGYFTGQTTLCISPNCSTQFNLTPSEFASTPNFLQNRRNVMYIFKNARFDEVDVHAYGRWGNIPDVVRWFNDSSQNKPVIFMEGGGPFCKACERIYHSVNDTDGRLPAPLVRDNASYVVYYFITGFASGVKKQHWHIGPEYNAWGPIWGDLDLKSINFVSKPSFYVYRWLAKTLFSNANADTVVKIPESNTNLYHYQIQPLGLNVIWSTTAVDSFIVNGTGTLYRWDIPTTCNSVYPTACDSVVRTSSMTISGATTITLIDGVPVFYSWGNVLTEVSESRSFIPTTPTLYQNYPNPFNPTTKLSFVIGHSSLVSLKVFDVLGREVATLVDEELNPGEHSVVFNAKGLVSGVYFYRLTTPTFSQTKSMAVIK